MPLSPSPSLDIVPQTHKEHIQKALKNASANPKPKLGGLRCQCSSLNHDLPTDLSPFALTGCVDAVHANDLHSCQFTPGCDFTHVGAAVAHKSKLPSITATSSTQAESLVTALVTKIALHVHAILQSSQDELTFLHKDNVSNHHQAFQCMPLH